ncbi:MAG: heavy metal-responsive transcriptional regulator [Cyanobacteria bacterium P01_A01_bin.116]
MTTEIRLKIGEVSKQTGIAVGALRYYESLSLIKSERGKNGYRYYHQSAVQQVQFIKKAQSLGFSLEDVGDVLNAHKKGTVPCELVQSLLQEKIDQLGAQIQEMTVFKQGLETYRDSWASTQPRPKPGDICPLIETISL